jgi:hypothetical protein
MGYFACSWHSNSAQSVQNNDKHLTSLSVCNIYFYIVRLGKVLNRNGRNCYHEMAIFGLEKSQILMTTFAHFSNFYLFYASPHP